MDKLRRLSLYWDAYQPHQLRTYRLAREWMEAGVTAADATAWADAGYLPSEAAPLIAQGITPQMTAVADEVATEVAGSQEERAMQEIDRLVATGQVIDPLRVRITQDPHDPDAYTVHILPAQ